MSESAKSRFAVDLGEFERQIAQAHEPHRVAFYLYDIASSFHSLWNKGKDLPQLRFVNQNDKNSSEARLALVHALKGVLASGLRILGVTAPDEMR